VTRVALTIKSQNTKTGTMPVSVSEPSTCPESCPLRGHGCYAELGPLGMHWRKVGTERGVPWPEFCAAIEALPEGQLWRHNAAGDLPDSEPERDALVAANEGRRGFTYTHKLNLAKWAADACGQGFTVNLSAETLAQADKLLQTGCPVCVLLPEDAPKRTRTPAGRVVLRCPATVRDGVTCASCALCARADRRVIVGFPVHGTSKRKAGELIE
jgi:hypothetical protein